MLGSRILLFTFILWAFAAAFFTKAGAAEKNAKDLFDELEKDLRPPGAAKGIKDLFDEIEKDKAPAGDGGKVEDLFEEMEGRGKAAAPPEIKKSTLLTQMWKNLEGSLRMRYSHFFHPAPDDPNVDAKYNFIDYILRFNTFTGENPWRLDLSGWAQGGNQNSTFSGTERWFQDNNSQDHRHLQMNELYLTLFRSDYDLIMGKKLFPTGINTLYSPSDRLRPVYAYDPLDPEEIGIWQARIDYYRDRLKLTGAILPVYTAPKVPHESSRWVGNAQKRDFFFYEEDVSEFEKEDSKLEEEIPKIRLENLSYFARGKTTTKGWDLFASAYSGLNPYYVVKEENRNGKKVGIKKVVDVLDLAAGFSTTYKKWELHGETLLNYSYENKDDHYLTTCAGFTYTIDDWASKIFMERIDVTLEYSYEWLIEHQSAQDFVASSETMRGGRRDIFSRIDFKYSEDLRLEYLSNWVFKDQGYFNRLEAQYRINPQWIWSVALEAFNGPDDSYYGRWAENDRLITQLEYKF